MDSLRKSCICSATLLSILLYLSGTEAASQKKGTIDQKKAVEIAEVFVTRNGCTSVAVPRHSSFSLEPGENASHVKEVLASRFDSLESQAVIALIKTEGTSSFWSVQFLFRDDRKVENGYDLGREVRLSLDGLRVWMNPKPLPVWESKVYGDCVGEEPAKP